MTCSGFLCVFIGHYAQLWQNKLMGVNKGFAVERAIISNLNNKKFTSLSIEYKKLVVDLYKNINAADGLIQCSKNEGTGLEKKNDLTLKFQNKTINVSIKSGSANSIHQENIHSFVEFLESKKSLDIERKNLIYEFHWCDGTLDNSGSIKDRKRKSDYKKIYKKKYSKYMNALREYKKEIFYRIFTGTENQPDFTVYFKNNQFFVLDFKDLLSKHLNMEETDNNVGILTIQNWNACLQGQDLRGKKHRNDVQFKCKDFERYLIE